MRLPPFELENVDAAPFVDFVTQSAENRAAVVGSRRLSDGNTEIVPPGYEKFFVPDLPVFSQRAAIGSLLSLAVLLAAAVTGCVLLAGRPFWVIVPFLTVAAGSLIGFLYELVLLIQGRPYALLTLPYGPAIQAIRGFLFPIVCGSSIILAGMFAFGATEDAEAIVLASGVVAGFLFAAMFWQAPPLRIATVLVAAIIFTESVLLLSPSINGYPQLLLQIAMFLLLLSPFIGPETPQKSLWFHLVATASTIALLLALLPSQKDWPWANDSLPELPLGWMCLGIATGLVLAFYLLPQTWARVRSGIANVIWPLFYLIVAGGARIPRPNRLSEVYKGLEKKLRPLPVLPYYVAHPRQLTHHVSVPCLDDALTVKVHSLGFFGRLVKFVFAVASVIDQVLPHANTRVPLARKPRMRPWSDGSDYWPKLLLRRIRLPRLGWFSIEAGVRGPGKQPAPQMAIDAYKRGQLLAYLVEYGVANSFLSSERIDGRTIFTLDFGFLEGYETKQDYEPYGGVAKFDIDESTRSLRLISVQAPRSDVVRLVDPLDASFRHAEDMILASIYFYVVSGKHLVEIHMGLNLLEVALLNAFDARQQWMHPVRQALYPHLFAHELAEELTTQHLLEDGAVFPQIFATTNAALMRHLNDRFSEYVLHADEDFDRRRKVITLGHDGADPRDILPHNSLNWELQYAAIWQDYARSIVDAAYADDAAVAEDEGVRILYANLSRLYRHPLSQRFEKLETRSGLARFIADTMHHLIIRHEVYGTTGVRVALDPRIIKVQVPTDGGPYGVDEWRSLACIAMATSRVRYALLMDDFSYLFDDIEDPGIQKRFKQAHDRMKGQLKELEEQFKSDDVINYEIGRLLPSELEIGAGY